MFLLKIVTVRRCETFHTAGGWVGCKHMLTVCFMHAPCICRAAADWIFAADVADRHDQMHLVAHHVQMPLSALANLLTEVGPLLFYAYWEDHLFKRGMSNGEAPRIYGHRSYSWTQ